MWLKVSSPSRHIEYYDQAWSKHGETSVDKEISMDEQGLGNDENVVHIHKANLPAVAAERAGCRRSHWAEHQQGDVACAVAHSPDHGDGMGVVLQVHWGLQRADCAAPPCS